METGLLQQSPYCLLLGVMDQSLGKYWMNKNTTQPKQRKHYSDQG